MGEVSREHVPEIGETLYLRKHITDYWTSYEAITLTRETSRSWVSGEAWAEVKYSKKEYIPCSRREYDEYRWLTENRYKISKKVEGCNDPGTLRQIAALIGYEEGK